MKVTFLGHAAVLLEGTNFKVLVDPFLTGNPSYIPNPNHIIGITHIFVTHGHQDHIGDTIKIARKNNSMIVSNNELADFFKGKNPNLNVHPMDMGEKYHFSFGDVLMTRALHGSVVRDGNQTLDGGQACGFVFMIDGFTIYHLGDTSLIDDFKALKSYNIDMAFLPIGGHYTMDIDDAVKAVGYLRPKTIIPMHYNTFTLIQANPHVFKNNLPNHNVVIMKSGESIDLIE